MELAIQVLIIPTLVQVTISLILLMLFRTLNEKNKHCKNFSNEFKTQNKSESNVTSTIG